MARSMLLSPTISILAVSTIMFNRILPSALSLLANKGCRIYVDIMTGEKLASILLANMTHLLVSSFIQQEGRKWGQGGGRGAGLKF